jgi:hypothetical protein
MWRLYWSECFPEDENCITKVTGCKKLTRFSPFHFRNFHENCLARRVIEILRLLGSELLYVVVKHLRFKNLYCVCHRISLPNASH